MKCEEAKKIIYLFEESDKQKRETLERHLVSCAACASLFNEERSARQFIQDHFPAAELTHPQAFTTRVMATLNKSQDSIWKRWFLLVPGYDSMRLSLGIFSSALLIFLVMEINRVDELHAVPAGQITKRDDVVLNSTAFAEKLLNKKSGSISSLAYCIKYCYTSTPECEDCRIKIKKYATL